MRSWEDRITLWSIRAAAITDDLTNRDPAKLTELQTALRPTLTELADAVRAAARDKANLGDRVEQLLADADRIIDNVVPNWHASRGMALNLERIHRAHAQ